MSRENLFGYPFSPKNLHWGLRYPINSKTGKRTRPDFMPVSNHTLKSWFNIDPKVGGTPSKVLKKKHPLNSSMTLVFGRNFLRWPDKRSRAAAVIQRAFRARKKYPIVYTSKKNAKLISSMGGFVPIQNVVYITHRTRS